MKMSAGEPIQRFDFNNDIDVEEVEESEYTNGRLYDQFYEMAEKFSGTYIGQYITGKIDSFLKLIEDTAKWSLPPKNTNESTVPLKRPLPWIPFIALILVLRLIRIGLSIGGLLIGNAPLVPSDVVYFIQTRRRKLRAIRIAGMKEIGKNEEIQQNKQRGGLVSKITSIMSMAICRPKLVEDTHKILVSGNCTEEAGSSGLNMTQQNHNSSRTKCLEDEDADLSLSQMLDKYGASSNEDDDSDFVPPDDAFNDVDTSCTSTSSTTSDEEYNDEAELQSTEKETQQTMSNNIAEPESNDYVTNGNSSIESQELSMEVRENGEHLSTKLRKPKIMPKPIKEEPLPLPTQEIKQELVDTDEDTNRIEFERSEDVNKSSGFNPHHHQKSIVEFENVNKGPTNKIGITENGIDQQIEKTNGDQKLIQAGSPDLCGTYGFQPTSILKNCQAVQLEQRGFTGAGDFSSNETFMQAESTNESEATSRPTKGTNHSGKPIKNKFRGKRR
ncbi:uncharacterized protein LOC129951585 isoform X2 [Eupeodes corollae]|uniref:uncharacterized protein LOC129951585 isoform X2 n=1 Tax=Eupeodes corollae TaxID=290404 RepID=UPI0024928892|nr:uncharacterized protein LOC129951585 isoform X2 [Eupeodes corollae]